MPDTVNSEAEINRVSLKLPSFWERQVDLWFINIEAQFVLANITQDTTKYYAVVSALNSEVLSHVSDIVKAPPQQNLYKTLKDRLILEFADSEQKRVKDLLSHTVLGDDKPTYLLRKMRQLADDKVGEEFLKTLWLQRLPKEMQAILSASGEPLDKVAQMADKISDLNPHQVSETRISPEKSSEISELRAQIEALTKQVEHLSRSQDRRKTDNFSYRRRRRSRTPKRVNEEICWYHAKFNEKAHKCVPPCKYQNQGN